MHRKEMLIACLKLLSGDLKRKGVVNKHEATVMVEGYFKPTTEVGFKLCTNIVDILSNLDTTEMSHTRVLNEVFSEIFGRNFKQINESEERVVFDQLRATTRDFTFLASDRVLKKIKN